MTLVFGVTKMWLHTFSILIILSLSAPTPSNAQGKCFEDCGTIFNPFGNSNCNSDPICSKCLQLKPVQTPDGQVNERQCHCNGVKPCTTGPNDCWGNGVCTRCNFIGGDCYQPYCGVPCTDDRTCAGAQDGCASCRNEKCSPPPKCGDPCTDDETCAGAQNGCVYCHATKYECCKNKDGEVCGDPHFKTWHGKHFSYHGECDLVLVQTDGFSNGLGLRIHIRTKIEQTWSYVKFAAIKIGNDVLEVQGQGEVWDKSAAAVHYINGNLNAELPFKLSGKYPVVRLQEKQCSTDESNCVEAIIYKIDLFEGGSIKVTQQWGVIRLGVTVGGSNDFDGSVGIMGHLSKPGFWARDSLTQFTEVNINQFGQEWQVQESEPMIFNERRAPQHPEQCRLPAVSTKRRLRKDSVLHQMALDACAGVEEASKEFCIFDVTATGRVEAASIYYTAYVG